MVPRASDQFAEVNQWSGKAYAARSAMPIRFLELMIENAVERLLLADLHSADQLKEEAVRYIVMHMADICQSESYAKLKGRSEVVMELMAAQAGVSGGGKKRAREEEAQEGEGLTPASVRAMKVGQLRAELSKRGLDVDGVRAVLMTRLEAAIS